ncbi:hypothetical protein GOP47_0006321 [Adiantum capillus-veneris]|uniref:Uncharacterized protein n=1 Tax=Adiantum capillus-veneris TaxID=13818 RepID=A0A9D4V375_ADICA|nr:hypothetical protein GOP47_0006321 [Adiantum capillus-veneris]
MDCFNLDLRTESSVWSFSAYILLLLLLVMRIELNVLNLHGFEPSKNRHSSTVFPLPNYVLQKLFMQGMLKEVWSRLRAPTRSAELRCGS